MKTISVTLFIVTCLSIFSQQAYSSSSRQLQQDANRLCQVYDPANWEAFSRLHTRFEVYPELGMRIRNAIKTPEFHHIFEKYLHTRNQSYYKYVTEQVSKLIGRKWICAYFENFESTRTIKFLRISTVGIHKFTPAISHKNIILITITKNGDYLINDIRLIDNKAETLKQGIKTMIAKEKNINILVQADTSSPSVSLLQLLYVAKSLNIKFIDFEIQ